ncbi:MAG: LysR family transcriptional regulator [Megasphaera sp.]|jgi:DNA-binding transcriptional LysR family regulator|uniref:LysR family transcriptional regulator n=1 Tax=Megasphaera sueciensis TaxID=349094 RepID=UPI002ACB17AE|nr:LysR family transcriptional regulator [Megasphaera sp.]MCI1823530.1 LysR family transcriptional regulator [Megasphaera sp.]
MMNLPNIQQLENFIIYGKVRNFTAAAKEANITQSAFSFQMKKLEERIGVQLIVRSNKGSNLTEEGELFLKRVEVIFQNLEECICDIQALGGQTLSLSVGTLMSLGDVLMNRHLAYFQKHHPKMPISVYNLEARELLKQLEEDKLDIISTFCLPQMNINKYEQTFFCTEKMVYYAPNMHIENPTVSADYMARRPLAQYSSYYLMNTNIQKYFSSIDCHPVVQAWFSTPYAIMQYCQENLTGALLSERFLVAMGVYEGYYEVEPKFDMSCYLLYKHNNPKYKMMKIFIDYIRRLYQG